MTTATTNDEDRNVPKLGILGVAVISGIMIHFFKQGATAQAFMTSPTDWYGLITSAATIALLTAFAGHIPVVGPWLVAAIKVATGAIQFGKKIKDALPPQLVTDVIALVKSGKTPGLSDIEKLLMDFEGVDMSVIFDLIKQQYHAINDPTSPPATPLMGGSADTSGSDVPVNLG